MSYRLRSHSDPLSSPPSNHLPSIPPQPHPRPHPVRIISTNRHPHTSSGQYTLADYVSANSIRTPRSSRWPQQWSRVSPAASVTTVSDGEDEEAIALKDCAEAKKWMLKGEGKKVDRGGALGLAGTLPPEVLIHIFHQLPSQADLAAAMLVSRTWCITAFPLLWLKPNFRDSEQIISVARVISSPNPMLPYAKAIRRLNLSLVRDSVVDEVAVAFEKCERVERLYLIRADHISSWSLRRMIRGMRMLVSVDFTDTCQVNDQVLHDLGKYCPVLQGINLTGCRTMTDLGLGSFARRARNLKRFRVPSCLRITDDSLVPVINFNPHLLEVDLSDVEQLGNVSVYALFINCPYLRDVRLKGNALITDVAFPNLPELREMDEEDSKKAAETLTIHDTYILPSHKKQDKEDNSPTPPQKVPLSALGLYRPLVSNLDYLRAVDLSGCIHLGDDAVKNLVASAPRIRNLTLSKCTNLTDAAVESICNLGRNLHHLQLGHCNQITDEAMGKLARACSRLRYIDLACCSSLTDLSVSELATNLLKLRRIGLVKVTNLTDAAVYALVERHETLERVHLSHCSNLSVEAITVLLNCVPGLIHLSLTGVDAFKSKHLQQFCRPTPEEFNEQQSASFCVYSGHGISALRSYLNSQQAQALHSHRSSIERRDSDSSISSLTPRASPPPYMNDSLDRLDGLYISHTSPRGMGVNGGLMDSQEERYVWMPEHARRRSWDFARDYGRGRRDGDGSGGEGQSSSRWSRGHMNLDEMDG
ncbi:hypothetical protein M231_01956 [Tremella mesenterica]|uniref:Uncharacterized protein n=1 Tax=Tremella mesenterica TaxID=5217 RepID=A0A4Q1BRU8_TREME|nr:hypothetical protein M231_01956 [Tremella mesenterica]